MSSEELLSQIDAAVQAREAALARSNAARAGAATPFEVADLRDAVALASMKLVRLQGRWAREFGDNWPQTAS